MKKSFDVLIVGIGGQGTILASNVLGDACVIEGRHVRGAETHGMSQRGGSVETHIRIDGKFGSLIAPGTADLLIAFDVLEAVRYRHFLKPDGVMIVNREIVVPTSVFSAKQSVPKIEDVEAELKAGSAKVILVDATSIAAEAGNPLAANIVLLGAASHNLPLAAESLSEAVRRNVPPKTVQINEKAFNLGKEAV
ncbi:pyruvate ferredoxin/flavodoxin oxidoreductase [Methanocorpusculum labreanum Z]|uniref:Pyruvate ferredoxin/flavodoxin oxidoreductase n=1 Tax=Methanocorpusculum labreanum (strain ATCC 43576 / DSM 4855 / Z) TaxID=410358 RepID=A2STZ9_METLZ|nr:indolepyruvate oxidoreductase subunit beta [Methanocorpusculum labreanum]ABN07805.1 pyruvate ferredoxin/flavodoxin oxidoreductase [Methanocorpusculum labreanum Z]